MVAVAPVPVVTYRSSGGTVEVVEMSSSKRRCICARKTAAVKAKCLGSCYLGLETSPVSTMGYSRTTDTNFAGLERKRKRSVAVIYRRKIELRSGPGPVRQHCAGGEVGFRGSSAWQRRGVPSLRACERRFDVEIGLARTGFATIFKSRGFWRGGQIPRDFGGLAS